MARHQKRSRKLMMGLGVVILVGALTAAFWPRATYVDIAAVRIGPMVVTIDEEGRTQVKEPYIVSSPVAGELQRVTVLPGEKVIAGQTVVAEMRPANPSVLDVRTREQARAAVTAAEAALRVAEADLNAALAVRDYADREFERFTKLVEREIASQATLDRAEQAARVADAHVDTARAAIAMRKAEVINARAQLIGIDDAGLARALGTDSAPIRSVELRAPIDGTILKVMHKSETTLPAGEPILEIGDIEGDLEVVVELLSSDAVRVSRGNRVIITNWGGIDDLEGVVSRIDPYGYTKYSALGVEEQRVEATISFTGEEHDKGNLGHGYRVEVRIVVWERENVVIVPSSALFRQHQNWAVYVQENGRATPRPVSIGQNNGVEAQVLDGVQKGDRVVLFPSANLVDGTLIAQRQID